MEKAIHLPGLSRTEEGIREAVGLSKIVRTSIISTATF
jgi:hypothetical protein